MNKVLVLAGALALVPALVLAQAPPPPDPPPMGQAMRGMMQQQMSLHRQFRSQVLGALSSAHRSLLESIIGQLAISDNPDPRAAVRKLDAALTVSERSKIINARNSFISKERALHEQMMAQFRQAHPNMPSPPPHTPRALPSPDAGRILLMTAMAHRGMMGPGFGMRRAFMGGFMGGMMFMHRGMMHRHGMMHSPAPSPAPTAT